MSQKLKVKAGVARGKKAANTIRPPHVATESLTIESGDGSVVLTACGTADGTGLWLTDSKDPLHGVAIYKVNGQMAVGVRAGNAYLAAALSADAATGEGLLQLTDGTGDTVVLTATEIINAIRNVNKLLPACCEDKPKAVKAKKTQAPKVAKVAKAKKSKKAKKVEEVAPAE